MSKYLATFEVPVRISLSESQRREANRALNMHYLGKPQFDSLEEVAKSEHVEAAFHMNATHIKTIKVGMLTDGTLEIINAD